jgi:hypothetical protein
MAILVFSPQSKTFVSKGSDGKFAPTSLIRVSEQGIVNVKGKATEPAILASEKATINGK